MINLENFADKINNKLENLADWKALHRLSMLLLKPDTIQQKLERILQTVVAFHNTPYGLVSFFDPVTGTLAVKANVGLNDAAVAAVGGIRPGQGCCGFSFAEQRRTVIEDFQVNEQFSEFRPWAAQHSIRAVYSTPFYDISGEVMGVLSVYFDKPHTPTIREQELADICATTIALILDRDRTETALRREGDRRDQVLRGMAEGFCVLDRNFKVLEMNAAGLRIDKRPFHELVGQNYWTLWPETDSEVSQQLRKAMTERITVHLENRVQNTAGHILWFAIGAHPIDEGLALFFDDITNRKKTEEAVRNSETRYRLLSESISTFVWRTDAQGVVIDGGESWNRYTGHDGDPQEWYEVVHPDDRENTRKSWEAILRSRQASQFTCRVLRRDETYRNLITHAVPWMDDAGNVKEWVGSCEDITESSLYE
ncbi:MAG: PAS domain S-box protein, partial [Proteobacteria bacterium]